MSNSILYDLQNRTLISFLDFSRWVAAAIVLISHLRNPLFISYGSINPEDLNIVIQGWYFVTGWAGEAVIIFFVLSGLLVGASGFEKINSGTFSTSNYLIDRFSRLYVAFFPALIVSFFLDYLGSTFFFDVGFWDHSHPLINEKIESSSFETKLTIVNFAANFLMLQHFFFDTLGSNSPLWTISAEFWFYIVFSAFALLRIGQSRTVTITLFFILLIFIYFFNIEFIRLFGYWLIGVFAGIMKPNINIKPIYAFLVVLSSLIFSRFYISPSSSWIDLTATNYFVAMSYGLLILSIRNKNIFFFKKFAKINKFLASFSFSLYLIHFPLMLFLLAVLNQFQFFSEITVGFSPTSYKGIMLYVLLIFIICLISYIFSLFTEKKTFIVRNWMKIFFHTKALTK